MHKFPLRIVNDKVMLVIEHPNLFNPVFKIYLKCSQIMQQQMAHARHLNGVSTYARTIRRLRICYERSRIKILTYIMCHDGLNITAQ